MQSYLIVLQPTHGKMSGNRVYHNFKSLFHFVWEIEGSISFLNVLEYQIYPQNTDITLENQKIYLLNRFRQRIESFQGLWDRKKDEKHQNHMMT